MPWENKFGKKDKNNVEVNSELKRKRSIDNDLYYNDNYAIENFVQVFVNQGDTDTFKVLNDPTYLGFKLFFHFDALSGLLAEESNVNSALAYLNRIGQTGRYNLLNRFINVLSRVNSYTPWIFDSIDGISEIYEQPFHEVDLDKQITIHTKETIDCKIASLTQMYRHIVYDYDRMVEIVPANLRRFSMSVYLYDFRNFDDTSVTATDTLQTIKNQDIRSLNHMMFDLSMCEFTTKSGSAFVSTVSNVDASEPVANQLIIDVKKANISSLFKTITGDTTLSPEEFVARDSMVDVAVTGETEFKPEKGISKLWSSAKASAAAAVDIDNLKTQAQNIVEDAARYGLQYVTSALTARYLGNVYGFDLLNTVNFGSNFDYRQQFNNISSRLTGSRSLDNAEKHKTTTELGNVYTKK
jgi:hypothetical protein